MHAFKDDVTVYDEATMNELLSLQPTSLIREGTAFDGKSGAGTTANDVFANSYAIRVTAAGVSEITRITLAVDADGIGEDLTVLVKNTDFNPDGSNEGTTLATITVPKEFLPKTAGPWSVPIVAVTGLTPGNNYWIIIPKAGDSVNHVHLVGEASQDAAHPCYRRAGSSGAWTANNALHFASFAGDAGKLVHGLYAANCQTTLERNSGRISKIYAYLPPADGPAGGVRKIWTASRTAGNRLKGGSVS